MDEVHREMDLMDPQYLLARHRSPELRVHAERLACLLARARHVTGRSPPVGMSA